MASTTLERDDWNVELPSGDVREAALELKGRPGGPSHLGGSTFVTDVLGWGLVDEYELPVYPCVAGHGPYPLTDLSHAPEPRYHRLTTGIKAT